MRLNVFIFAYLSHTLAKEPTGPASAAQGVAEFADQYLDGAAGAAGQVLLPVALGLEAAVAQAVGPGLHGLAWALGDVAN